MAVTKIWPVRGRLDHPIDYAMNPEKTDASLLPDSLDDVMHYAVNEEKTEKQFYVSGVNCNPAIARREFQIVKEQFGKTGGIIAYHAYQSFAEGEVTPEQAHQIGTEFARKVWGENFQVVVATHLNTHCLHNHFVVNSVSFRDGRRCRQKQWTELSRTSDEICKIHQLGIVERHGKGLTQSLAKAEREGAPTRLVIAKEAVDEGLSRCCNLREFRAFLISLGYVCQFDENRKYWTIRQHDWKRPIRLARMGEEYTNEKIRERLRSNSPEVRKQVRRETRPVRGRRRNVKVNRKKTRKLGGLRGLYWHYCYLLGYYPRRKTKFYKVPPALRDDLMKLNYISQEARLLQEYHIDSLEQLLTFRQSLQEKIECLNCELALLCKIHRNRSTSDAEADRAYAEMKRVRDELKECKQQITSCERIEVRSEQMKVNLQLVKTEKIQCKENVQYKNGR